MPVSACLSLFLAFSLDRPHDQVPQESSVLNSRLCIPGPVPGIMGTHILTELMNVLRKYSLKNMERI